MKNLFLGLLSLFTLANAAVSLEEVEFSERSNKIKKLSENFYYGKVKDKPLYAIMEKVTKENHDDWLRYSDVQRDPKVIRRIKEQLKNNNTVSDGSDFFYNVLCKSGGYGVVNQYNEVWIAYLVESSFYGDEETYIRQYNNNDKFKYYTYNRFINQNDPEALTEKIKMYVTVTSSKNAIITSHMGICLTAESVYRPRVRSISMDLHSFAAKVMKEIDAKKRFMVSVPISNMEMIIADSLPGKVYIGTRGMIEQDIPSCLWDLEQYKTFKKEEVSVIVLKAKQEKLEELTDYNERLSKAVLQYRELLEAFINMKNSNNNQKEVDRFNEIGRSVYCPDSLLEIYVEQKNGKLGVAEDKLGDARIIEHFNISNNFYIPSYFKLEGAKFVLSEEGLSLEMEIKIKQEFEQFKSNAPFKQLHDCYKGNNFKEFLEKHPPIISVDKGHCLDKKMVVYDPNDPQTPLITIEKKDHIIKNEDYNWLFDQTFAVRGNNHYVAVDLKALRDCRELE